MKWLVSLVVGFLFAFLLLRLLRDTVGFPAGWPIFIAAAAGLVALSLYLEHRRRH